MTWTRAADLKAQVARLWSRGELLRAGTREESCFPLRLTLKSPSSGELAAQFEAVRTWIADVSAVPRVRLEWREVNHRVLGAQRVPHSAWIDTREDALALIGKRGEAARFDALLALTRARESALVPWLTRRPLYSIELADDWERLLAVVNWFRQHPRAGVYLRQVDIPGVHSKFIEAHRGVLMEWLDLVLSPEAIAAEHTGTARFAARYGLLDKPARVRFRVLDARIALVPGAHRPDVTLDASSFAMLTSPIRRVFVTENEINFLAFPEAAGAIVVFGGGYAAEALASARWLARSTVHYWGDIDTHGFSILARLRARLPRVRSFLMDRGTLMAHEALWGEESEQVVHDLPALAPAEQALYDELRDNRIRKGLRLEQERIGFGWVTAALDRLLTEDE